MLNRVQNYEKSSISNDLSFTITTIKGYHRTLAEQISSFGKNIDQNVHSAVTSGLSPPPILPSKVHLRNEISIGDTSLPILSGRPVQNFSFLGRESQLTSVHNSLQYHLKPSEKGPSCCIIHGIGGIGKTQTALQYTYVYEHFYEAIFWLKAETNIELAKSYAAIAEEVGTADSKWCLGEDGGLRKGIDIARRWLQTTSMIDARHSCYRAD